MDVRVELALGAGAAVEWRELIVLGRTGEPPGQATLRWDVTRLGRPVLRQFRRPDRPAPDLAGRAHRAAPRARLRADRRPGPRASDRGGRPATAVAQRVDDHTLLVTVLDDDAARAARQLDELCTRACG